MNYKYDVPSTNTMSGETKEHTIDIFFTQDGLDADNLPATRGVAEYCTDLKSQGINVRLFLDVSTAHRDFSQPRFAGGRMGGTLKGFMGNRYYVDDTLQVQNDVLEDTKACNRYDCMVLHSVASTYFDGDIYVIKENITHQQLWDPIVPNHFLMTKVENDKVVGRSLEEYKAINTVLNARKDRRQAMRDYINGEVEKYPDYSIINMEAALEELNSSSSIEVIICAPMVHTKLVLQRYPTKISSVYGEFGTLNNKDNVVGAQWNEYLDDVRPLLSAHESFAAMREAEYPVFFTPTQMFKNEGFIITEKIQELIHEEAKRADGTNLFLSYQKCWNAAKRGAQPIFDPLCIIAKRFNKFETTSVNAGDSMFRSESKTNPESKTNRTFECPKRNQDGTFFLNDDLENHIMNEYMHLYGGNKVLPLSSFVAQRIEESKDDDKTKFVLDIVFGRRDRITGAEINLNETGGVGRITARMNLCGNFKGISGLVKDVVIESSMGANGLEGHYRVVSHIAPIQDALQRELGDHLTANQYNTVRSIFATQQKASVNMAKEVLDAHGVDMDMAHELIFHSKNWCRV